MTTTEKNRMFQFTHGLIWITIMILGLVSCQSQKIVDEDQLKLHKQLAGELRDNKLFDAAIDEYETILKFDGLSGPQRANVNYLIARIYFDDLRDYRNAAAFYLRARALNPEGSFMQEASQNLVASLQKMGNVLDAAREMKSATDIGYQSKSADDVPVARINGEQIYRSRIEKEIKLLPGEMQKQFLTPESRIEFTRHFVGAELLYRAAVRENYPNDPEIIRQTEDLTRKLVVDKYIIDKVMPEISIDTLDVRNYYLANKESRYNNKPYDSIKVKVLTEYQQEKAETAYSEFIADLARAENVEFLDGNW